MASSSARKEKPSLHLWSSTNVEYSIACLEVHESEMDYENVGFISDLIALFSRIRKVRRLNLWLNRQTNDKNYRGRNNDLLTTSFNPGRAKLTLVGKTCLK